MGCELHLRLFMFLFSYVANIMLLIERLHLVFLILPIVPAVPRLWHQQGDDVAFSEAEQGAVVTSGVGENGLYASASILLQSSRHRT